MQKLFSTYARLLASNSPRFFRYLYKDINWDNKLIVIKGAKGVGKTTLLLQHISNTFDNPSKALYASVDNLWFSTHSILELAEYHYTHGGTHLFLDEIHKYRNWDQEIKNIYDSYPDLHVVITGSSMLKIEQQMSDLSRRARQYELAGMSFREFIKLEQDVELPVLSLETILSDHFVVAQDIITRIKVLPLFEKYVKCGYYPFYKEEGDGFPDRLRQVVNTVIETEIPSIENVEYNTVFRAKQLLNVLSERAPFTVNLANLSQLLETSRNSLMKLLELMDKGALIRRLFSTETGMSMFVKPEKILFENTNIMYALSTEVDPGTMRETLFSSQLSVSNNIYMPNQGDIVVNNKYLFEIGGKGKKFKQIKDIENSYVVADNIEIGFGNKIPLWMFGFLY